MRKVLIVAFIAAASGALAAEARGAALQDPAPGMVELKLRDGSRLYGQVQTEEPDRIVVKTTAGTVMIVPRDEIDSIKPVEGRLVDGEFWLADRLTSKLVFGSTGRTLRRGEGYVAIYGVLVPVMQIGVTDRFSFGVGKPFYVFSRDFWVTPKYQVYRGERTSAAVGVLHFFIPGAGSGGFAYVSATRGTTDDAFTLGGGWAYARGKDDGWAGGAPILIVGGEHRAGRRVKVITENFITREGVLLSVGARLIRRRFSTEVGMSLPLTALGGAPPGPFVNFVWHPPK